MNEEKENILKVSNKLVIICLSCTILPICSSDLIILLLFHSPKGSRKKSTKYMKLRENWSYCTPNFAKKLHNLSYGVLLIVGLTLLFNI